MKCNNVSWFAFAVVYLGWTLAAHAVSDHNPHVLNNVPNYPISDFLAGCTPIAAGDIFGYYDLRGYSNLFDASGADLFDANKVIDQISSPAHNAKYNASLDPTDNPDLPVPPKTSIAGFLGTGVGDDLAGGDTFVDMNGPGMEGYAAYRGYTAHAVDTGLFVDVGSSAFWDILVHEIDAGRPMMFVVDSDGDGLSDHTVPVFGYQDFGTVPDPQTPDLVGKWYSFHSEFTSQSQEWTEFLPLPHQSGQYQWGIDSGNTFVLDSNTTTVPLPASAWTGLSGLAAVGLLAMRKRAQLT